MNCDLPKISVVVPVYNVEMYLERCLDSILTQSYHNIEVILIDDGSTDNSSILCDNYQIKDKRVRVIHKTNGGLSSARNEGLKYVTGEYISFIDSDDWVKQDFYTNMISGINTKVDIVIGNYSLEIKDKIYNIKDINEEGLYCYYDIITHFLSPLLETGRYMQLWTNLYSLDLIRRNNMSFVSEREVYAEDDLFNTIAYYKCNSVYKINSPSYIHRVNQGSLSQSYRAGLYQMLNKRNQLKKDFFVKENRIDLIDLIDGKDASSLAYCLYKESLCDYKTACDNVKCLCNHIKNKEGLVKGKYSVLYHLGKYGQYNLIVLLSKLFRLFEPLYRQIQIWSQI